MPCDIPDEQLWSWVDRDAPELEEHLATCPHCQARAGELRHHMRGLASVTTPLKPPMPDQIGRYAIHRLIGEGGQAFVYEAEQQMPRRRVALKVLKGGCFNSNRVLRNFLRESQTLADLDHPAVAKVFEAGQTPEGQHFIAMQLVEGVPLDAFVRHNGLAPEQILRLFQDVCDAVQHAHDHGVIHRDLKPSNIIVSGKGCPKIVDFGLVRMLNKTTSVAQTVTEPGQVIGTLRYMSPEQVRGETERMDARSDVYSLGVILYELLTGHEPYEVGTVLSGAEAVICGQTPRRISSTNQVFRGDLETIVGKALEKEPRHRYQSAGELREDLVHFLANKPIEGRRPSTVYRVRKTLARHRWKSRAVAALLVVTVSGIIAAVADHHSELARARRTAVALQHHLESGSEAYSLEVSRKLIDAWPQVSEVRLVRAHAMLRDGQDGDLGLVLSAIITLEKHEEDDPDRWAFDLLRARVLKTLKDPQAQALEADALRNAPKTADAWLLRSMATLDMRQAADCAAESARLAPENDLALRRLAEAAIQIGEWDTALRSAEKLLQAGHDPGHWNFFIGNVLTIQGRYAEAQTYYDRAAKRRPEFYWPHRGRGLAHLCQRQYDEAVADYTQAVELAPNHPMWQCYQRATPLWIVGRFAEAADDYRTIAAQPGFTSFASIRLYLLLMDKARFLEGAGRPHEATLARREAEEILTDCWARMKPGSWAEAILECLCGTRSPDQLVAAASDSELQKSCEAFFYAGEACLLTARADEARAWFARCVETGLVLDPGQFPPDPMNEYHLARWRLESLPLSRTASAD